MFKINDYVVYKRDVCKIVDIKEKSYNNIDYYILMPVLDKSLKIEIPIDNKNGYLRRLINKNELEDLINEIPNIKVLSVPNKLIENEYKKLMKTGTHEDLIKVIKSTYERNMERIDNNKKVGDRDNEYFNRAEQYLYNEFSIVLNKSYEDTKKYVIDKLVEITK